MTPRDPRNDDRSPRSRTPTQYGLMLLGIYAAMLTVWSVVHALTPPDANAATTAQRSTPPAAVAVAPNPSSGVGQTAADDSLDRAPEALENSRECERGAGAESGYPPD